VTGRYMIATRAIHKLGDISRDEPDLCFIRDEDDDAYIGAWVTGLGYTQVRFPKDTTRDLTSEEVADYGSRYVQLNNYEPTPLGVNDTNSGPRTRTYTAAEETTR
jgi:hypothetical protein